MIRLLLAASLLFTALPAGAVTPAPPRRVASMNLSADEVLIDILPPERLSDTFRFEFRQRMLGVCTGNLE